MLPEFLAAGVDDRAGPRGDAARAQELAVVAAGHEADVRAVGLVGDAQAELASNPPRLRLGEVAEREAQPRELPLAERVEDVRLVLRGVGGGVQPQQAVALPDARVVAGREQLDAERARAIEQRAELHAVVALEAGVGGAAGRVRAGEDVDDVALRTRAPC